MEKDRKSEAKISNGFRNPLFPRMKSIKNLNSKMSDVEETSGEHDHSEDPDSDSRSGVYHWSQLATQIITEGVSNNLKPTVILRNLRTHGALSDPD